MTLAQMTENIESIDLNELFSLDEELYKFKKELLISVILQILNDLEIIENIKEIWGLDEERQQQKKNLLALFDIAERKEDFIRNKEQKFYGFYTHPIRSVTFSPAR